METRLSKMTKEEIFEKETALRGRIEAICAEYEEKFHRCGHSISCAFERCTDETDYKTDNLETPAEYVCGYNCRASVIVKRPKTAEEKAEDDEKAIEIADAQKLGEGETCTMQEIRDDAAFDADNKAVAITQIMITRIYKAFWIDKIIICDDISPLTDDLEEFLVRLSDETIE